MTLSLCLIVKDEAANLPACLGSVEGLADEIWLTDTGSTDNTVAVAQHYGAQIQQFQWTHDFAAARNASLQPATQDWILVLDGDEQLGPGIAAKLRDWLPQVPPTVLLINLLRQEVGAQQSPYTLVSRLFRNHAGIQFQRPYHETVDDSVAALIAAEPSWQVWDWPEVAILHHGYQPNAIASRKKTDRAQRIMATYLADHPEDAYICNKLGALYQQQGKLQQAQQLLQQGLKASQAESAPITTYELHYHLGLTYRSAGQLDQAAAHYRQALSQPIPPALTVGAWINLGSLLKSQQQLPDALACFKSAVNAAPELALAHYNLGLVYRLLGQLETAIAAYETAIALQPTYAEAYQNLGVALLKQGQRDLSQTAFAQALIHYEQQDPAAAARLRQGLQQLG
jgi:tetratricopeptide (TPR) repeat protein